MYYCRLSWPHSAFLSTLNSCIVSYRIICQVMCSAGQSEQTVNARSILLWSRDYTVITCLSGVRFDSESIAGRQTCRIWLVWMKTSVFLRHVLLSWQPGNPSNQLRHAAPNPAVHIPHKQHFEEDFAHVLQTAQGNALTEITIQYISLITRAWIYVIKIKC